MTRRTHVFLSFLTLLVAAIGASPFVMAQSSPDLGRAASYGVFTGVGGVNNTGLTQITGDIGTDAGAFTGFPPGVYTGARHVEDTESLLVKGDLTSAWNELENVPCDAVLSSTLGNGQVLTSQVYCSGAASTLSGMLTLDAQGDPNAVFIIKVEGALNVAATSQIVLANLAQASNVYWHIDGAVSILDNSIFRGTIISNGAIHLYDGTTLEGRALAVVGAITMASNMINVPLAVQPSSLVVIRPAAGDTLIAGTQNYQIEFVGVNVTLLKRIELSLDNGSTWSSIALIRNDSSAYSWNVPFTPSTQALIRITDSNGVSDTSGRFVIALPNPLPPGMAAMTVLSPGAGDTLIAGTTNYQIRFLGVNVAQQKTLEYSSDNGATWTTIATIVNDSTGYSWTVPMTPTTMGRVRITDANGVSGTGGIFVIRAPRGTLSVTRPATGESIVCGTQGYRIEYTGTNLTLWKRFEYSLDSGATWSLIGTDRSGASFHLWNVPTTISTRALVRVTDSAGVTGSSGLFSIVMSPAPTITLQPVSTITCLGTGATFTVTATGTGLTYQWRRNGVAIANATGSTYTIPQSSSKDAGIYDVIVGGACSPSTTSSAVTFTVDTEPVLFKLTESQTVAPGRPVTFSIVATGRNLRYQWWKGNRAIAGATASSFTIASVSVSDADIYSVDVSNNCSVPSLNSGGVFLFVGDGTGTASQSMPEDLAVCLGQPVRFVAPGNSIDYDYQWLRNDVVISGATSPVLEFTGTFADDGASYSARITGKQTGQSMVTSPATLSVGDGVTILSQPAGIEICAGEALSLSASAKGIGLRYQWRKNGVEIPGATASVYGRPVGSATDAGSYDVVILSACGMPATSSIAGVVVNEPTVITRQPVGRTVARGENVTFTAAASGSGLGYQWSHNGVEIDGARSATLTVSTARAEDAGRYELAIEDACGSTSRSESALLVVSSTSSVQGASAVTGEAGIAVAPHPAHGVTSITIDLPRGVVADAQSTLVLVDLNGNRVLDLSASFARGGFATASFDAAGIPAGLYNCQLVTRGWSGTLGSLVVRR